jgi:hypothetical protein
MRSVQDLFATSFRVQGRDDLEATYGSVTAAAFRWAWRGPGSPPDLATEPTGSRPEINGYRMSWTEWSVADRFERACEVILRHPDPQVAGREWRTAVDICRKSDCIGLTLRVAREAVELRVTPAALTTLRRPGLVPGLLNSYPCLAGSLQVTARPTTIHVAGVSEFIDDVLRDQGRALPVVVLAPPSGHPTDVDPGGLADELAGLAHVGGLGGHLAWRRFCETIGEGLYVPPGGVRLYWPGFGGTKDRLHHRYWTRRGLTALREPFARLLFNILARISVHAVPPDPLLPELRRAASEARLRALTAAGHSQDELVELYDTENRELAARVEELEARVENQARALATHQENYAAIAGAMERADEPSAEDEDGAPGADGSDGSPTTWPAFVELLPVLESGAFVITPEARDTFRHSPRPRRPGLRKTARSGWT